MGSEQDAACMAKPRREGHATALRAGRPFGIWRRCAWVLRFKELSKNPSIWAPSPLPARRDAEQMVRKQNSFACGRQEDLSKAACGWSSAPGATSAELLQEHLPCDVQASVCSSCLRLCPCDCTARASVANPALRAGCVPLIPAVPHSLVPPRACEIALQTWVPSSLGSG